MSKYRKLLAKNITSYMELRGWNQVELATNSGVSRGTISHYLNCESDPSLGVLEALAKCFDIEPWDLLRPAEITIRRVSPAEALRVLEEEINRSKKDVPNQATEPFPPEHGLPPAPWASNPIPNDIMENAEKINQMQWDLVRGVLGLPVTRKQKPKSESV